MVTNRAAKVCVPYAGKTATARMLAARGYLFTPRELLVMADRGQVPSVRTVDGNRLFEPDLVIAALAQRSGGVAAQ